MVVLKLLGTSYSTCSSEQVGASCIAPRAKPLDGKVTKGSGEGLERDGAPFSTCPSTYEFCSFCQLLWNTVLVRVQAPQVTAKTDAGEWWRWDEN